MGIQVHIADTYNVTLNDLLGLVPNSKAAKRYAEIMDDLGRLQKIVSDASEWADAEHRSRMDPEWLVDARNYLGTD